MRSLIIALVAFSTSLYGQDAREIINRYLDTVSNGNIENWNKIKSIYTESKVYYSQNHYEQKGNLVTPDKSYFYKSYRVLPYNHKIEIYDDSSFTKRVSTLYFLKDKTVALSGSTAPVIKEPPTRDEFFSVHLPVTISKLVNKSNTIELLGIKEFPSAGLSCYEITMTTKGWTYTLYINTGTFLLEYWNGREEKDALILLKLYNYRKVDDFLIPMSESLIKNGNGYFSSNTKKYVINMDIDLKVFDYTDN